MNLLKMLLLTTVWACSLFVPTAHALDIYQAEVSVADQTADARAQALGRALLEVAVKASGDASAASNSTVQSAQGSAERYMQRYAYRQAIVREGGVPVIKLFLTGTFYPSSIQQLLQRAGLAVWGRDRPKVDVYLFEGDTPLQDSYRSAMIDRSARRGLTLRFPSGATASDLSDPEALAQRLVRPGSNALFGRIDERIYLSDGRTTEALSSASLDGLSDRLAQTLARRSVIAENAPPESLVISVAGIASAQRYAQVLKYLGELRVVKSTKIQGANSGSQNNGQLNLELSVKGGAAQLIQSIGQGSTLQVISESPLQFEMR
jgi:hypothetical protein